MSPEDLEIKERGKRLKDESSESGETDIKG
jgi:hypothetical protein